MERGGRRRWRKGVVKNEESGRYEWREEKDRAKGEEN